MWTKFRTWFRRFGGFLINSIIFGAPILLAVFDYMGTNVDWNELVGEERGALYIAVVGGINMALRAFVTRTQGHPSDPLGT